MIDTKLNTVVRRLIDKGIAVPEVLVVEVARLQSANTELVAALEKVALFGESVDSLSIGHTAALVELGRNARAALKLANGE